MSANRKRANRKRPPGLLAELDANALLKHVNELALGKIESNRTQLDAARFLLGLLLAEAGADDPGDVPMFSLVIGVPAPAEAEAAEAAEAKPGNGVP